MLDNQSILITGGTGLPARPSVKTVLERHPGVRRLVVFSRDELQAVRDGAAVPRAPVPLHALLHRRRATRSACSARWRVWTSSSHAAALKQVPAAEYNPFECIKTNVLGAQNVIDACLTRASARGGAVHRQGRCADQPYGATKLCSDKLFVAANIKGRRATRFSVVPWQRDGQPRLR